MLYLLYLVLVKCRQKLVGFSKPLAFSTSSRKDLTQLVIQVDNRLFFCGDNLSVNDKRRLIQNKISAWFKQLRFWVTLICGWLLELCHPQAALEAATQD